MKRTTFIQVAALSASLLVGGMPQAVLGHPAPVPKTGVTDCSGPRPDCSYPKGDPWYGQDGQLQKGVAWPKPRFVRLVNSFDDTGVGGGMAGNRICDGTERCNGVVKDRLTALKWLANVGCLGRGDWFSALQRSYALANGQCGLRDGSVPGTWRLPNRKELQSVIDFRCHPALSDRLGSGCIASDPDPVFFNLPDCYLWSSSSSGPLTAWVEGLIIRVGWSEYFFCSPATPRSVNKDGTDQEYGFIPAVWPVKGGR